MLRVPTALVFLLVLASCGHERIDWSALTFEEIEPEPTPQELLLQICSREDNPSPISRETIVVGSEHIEAEVVRVPVQVQPGLEVETRWGAIGGWDDSGNGSVFWRAPWTETSTFLRRGSRLGFMLRHRDDGSLELSLLPEAHDYHAHIAHALIERHDDELIATLRGFLWQDYGPFIWPWDAVVGELRMSQDHWSVGDELSFFLEVQVPRGPRICGELRATVPERGETVRMIWPREPPA